MDVSIVMALWALAVSAFTSATILPGSSEVALAVYIEAFGNEVFLGWCVATIANGLGSATSLWLGRLIPPKKMPSVKIQSLINRFGSASMLLAWLPIVGDALPVAAGWLRLRIWPCCVYLLIGKGIRYAIIILLWQNGGSAVFNSFFG